MKNRTGFYWLPLLLLLITVSPVEAQVDSVPGNAPEVRVSNDSARAHFDKGRALIQAGQFKEAIEAFQQVLRLDPRNVHAYNGISFSHGKMGQHSEAIDAARKALEIQPDNAYAYGRLAYSYNEIGRYEEANKAAQRATQLNPQDVTAYGNLGASYSHLKQYKEAIEAFKRAIQLGADHFLVYYDLGVAYLQLGQYEKSIEVSQKSILRKPDARAYNNIGYAYLRLGRYEDSVEALKQSLRLDPKHQKASFNLGNAYFQQKRYEEAAEALKQAVSIGPENGVVAYMMLGVANTKLDRHEEAVEAFTHAIRLSPQESEAFRSRSYSHLYLAQGEAAATDALRYLDLSGWGNDHSPYMLIVAHFGYRQAGRDADAQRMLDKAVEKAGEASPWPYPMIRYLRREMTAQELLALADDGNKKTEAHACIGMNLSLSGSHDDALVHFNWIKENGNKSFTEYSLALAEIERLRGKSTGSMRR